MSSGIATRRSRALLAVAVTFVALDAAAPPARAAVVPGQFVAKLHTEGLGRAPAPGEWVRWVRRFEREGCALRSLRRAARIVYGGREFLRLRYGKLDRLAALHAAC